MTLARLSQVQSFSEASLLAGPHMSMGEERALPAGVGQPSEWIAAHVLPRPEASTGERGERQPNHRVACGMRFLDTYHVAEYVHRKFQPAAVLGPSSQLSTVSQWVEGADEWLLMEPLIPGRRNYETELTKIATTFSAYRYELRARRSAPRPVKLLAYLLPVQQQEKQRQHAREVLMERADLVMDAAVPEQRAMLIQRIRTVGQSRHGGSLLPQ